MSKGRLLVVEDDRIIAEDIVMTLKRLGYSVAPVASSGEEAIKLAAREKPDLALMDIVLKGSIDGIKAAGHIMKNYDIPVVYLSSHSDRATLKRASETGPFGYLLKPYDETDLRATLEMALYKHRMEKKVREREHWLDIILKSIGDAVIVTDSSGGIKFMNPAAEALTGWRQKEAMGRTVTEVFRVIDEDTRKPAPNPVEAVLSGEEKNGTVGHTILIDRDGAEIPVNNSAAPVKDDRGGTTDVVLVFHDETERRQALGMLKESERFLNTIFDSIHDPFCIIDRDFRIARVNDAYASLKGDKAQDIKGMKCHEAFEGRAGICEACVVESTFATSTPHSREKHLVDAEGAEKWLEIFTYPIRDDEGRVSHVIEYARDITQRKQTEEDKRKLIRDLEHLSRVDMLTGIMNRRALMDFLEQEVQRVKRYGGKLSLILCDIDRFKSINDTYGHAAGDNAMELIAGVFKDLARKADMAGRYGGDEFMLIMPETGLEGAANFAERLRETVEQVQFKPVPGKEVVLTLSFGVSRFDGKRDNVDTFISRADDALYASKNEGKNRVTVSSP